MLNEDQLANFPTKSTATANPAKKGKQPAGQADSIDVGRNLWDEEGDDFFGNSTGPTIQELDDEGTPVPTVSGRGRKKGDGTVSRRGRKPGPKPGRKKAMATGS